MLFFAYDKTVHFFLFFMTFFLHYLCLMAIQDFLDNMLICSFCDKFATKL